MVGRWRTYSLMAEVGARLARVRRFTTFHVTAREAEVLRLLASGLQDKEIVATLGMSLGTLRTHISRLFVKSGQRRRSGLVARWMTSRSEIVTGDELVGHPVLINLMDQSHTFIRGRAIVVSTSDD